MKDDFIYIEVLNWAKHQTRKDVKKMNYFRVATDIFIDERFYQLKTVSKLTWFVLLTLCARSRSALVQVSYKQVASLIQTRTNSVHFGVSQLVEYQLVKLVSRDEKVPREEKRRVEKRREEERREEESTKQAKPVPTQLHKLAKLWNEFSGDLGKVKICSSARNKKCDARWKEFVDDPENYWIGIITRISKSDFCNGQNDRGWVASFDWLIQPETHLKIDEGKFDNRKSTSNSRAKQVSQANKNLWDKVQKGEL